MFLAVHKEVFRERDMKLASYFGLTVLGSCLLPGVMGERFPKVQDDVILKPFTKNQKIPIQCIQRHIDTGEHKFDSNENIIYGPFPKCKESGEEFSLTYKKNEEVQCTVELTDELYHLFQLYIHEDAPFSCKIPIDSQNNAFIPLTFSFRGDLETSHLDIDTTMNVLVHLNENNNIVSSVGYSSGDKVERYIIGDPMPIHFNINWIDSTVSKKNKFHYVLNFGFSVKQLIFVSLLVGGFISSCVYVLLYSKFNLKLKKEGIRGISTELGISSDKKD